MVNHVLTPAQASAWTSYQRMRVRLAGQLNRELTRETGLSEADFEILAALIDAPDETVRALALRCRLEWEKSRLSHQLRRMEKRGLVRREVCTEDNRSTVIRVTDAGRRLAEDARRQHEQAVLAIVCDALTPEQLHTLGHIAEAVLAYLDDPARS